jgi:hypothetical protein
MALICGNGGCIICVACREQLLGKLRSENARLREVLQSFVRSCEGCDLSPKDRALYRKALDALKGGE